MYDGDFTVESDKAKLVDTILGLWAVRCVFNPVGVLQVDMEGDLSLGSLTSECSTEAVAQLSASQLYSLHCACRARWLCSIQTTR